MGDHHHNHSHSELRGKRLGITILLNIVITIAQIFGGLISGSLALLSDALHNFSDVISLLVSYAATRMFRRKSSDGKTFGYRRAEIIAALFNATTLLLIAVFLVKEAIYRLWEPQAIGSVYVIGFGLLSIIINGGSVLLIKEDSKNSLNMRSAYLHLFTDMITSVAVMAGGIAMYYWQIFWLDSVLSILIAVYLVLSSWDLLLKTLRVLMQFTPGDVDIKEIEKAINAIPQVENIHHVHIWQLNENETHFEGHVDFKSDLVLSETTKICCVISDLLKDKFDIGHSIIQPEFGMDDAKGLVVDRSECK